MEVLMDRKIKRIEKKFYQCNKYAGEAYKTAMEAVKKLQAIVYQLKKINKIVG